MEELDVDGVCVDRSSHIVTTPAYMQGNAAPHEVFDGIQTFLFKVSSLVRQQAVLHS